MRILQVVEEAKAHPGPVAYPGILFGVGDPTNSVEDRENGDLGAVAPQSRVLEAAVIWYKKFYFI